MRAGSPGLADQFQLGQACQQRGIDARALAGQHQRVGIGEALSQYIRVADSIVIHADIEAFQQAETIELLHDFLIVIRYHDTHANPPNQASLATGLC